MVQNPDLVFKCCPKNQTTFDHLKTWLVRNSGPRYSALCYVVSSSVHSFWDCRPKRHIGEASFNTDKTQALGTNFSLLPQVKLGSDLGYFHFTVTVQCSTKGENETGYLRRNGAGYLRWWGTGVFKRRADSAEMMGRPLSRWKLIRWLTESNVRSLVRTYKKSKVFLRNLQVILSAYEKLQFQ
jgi:hypothetical protein